jgi:hypothetical protein
LSHILLTKCYNTTDEQNTNINIEKEREDQLVGEGIREEKLEEMGVMVAFGRVRFWELHFLHHLLRLKIFGRVRFCLALNEHGISA